MHYSKKSLPKHGTTSPKKCSATAPAATAKKVPNTALVKGLRKREFYSAGAVPVYGDYYSHIDLIDSNIIPCKWRYLKDSEATETRHGNFYNSLKLRYAYKALSVLKGQNPNYIITAATVDISNDASKALSKSPRGVASAYGNNLGKRLARIDKSKPIYFVAVIEEKSGELHVHLMLLHHAEYKGEIVRCLKVGADTGAHNSVQIKKSYRRWSRAKAGSAQAELEELDRAEGLGNFPNEGVKRGAVRYYNNSSIDAGWFDYLSKALHRKSDLIAGHRHFYMQREVRSLTQSLYEQAREKYIEGIQSLNPPTANLR